MTISSMDALIAGFAGKTRANIWKLSTPTKGAAFHQSLMKVAGQPPAFGSNPTTAAGAIPSSSDIYAIALPTPSGSNKLYLARASFTSSNTGTLIIYDRLWHNSGLSGTSTTTQTINSTTLTRSTDGVGVEIWLEVYTALGGTATTITITYTDAANASVTGTIATSVSGTFTVAGQMYPAQMANSSVGVKSIQSCILSASTGTTGNFGLVMVKRIAEIQMNSINITSTVDAFALGMPEINASAHLGMLVLCSSSNTGAIQGSLDVIQG